MGCYDDQLNELSVAEYEMIWTLFHADKEEKKEDCQNCDSQDGGIGARLLRFLFGNNDLQDECVAYSQKWPYHRHIHQPVTRTRPKTHIGPDGTPWVEPSSSTRLIPVSPLAPLADGMTPDTGPTPLLTIATLSTILAFSMILASYQKRLFSSSSSSARDDSRHTALAPSDEIEGISD